MSAGAAPPGPEDLASLLQDGRGLGWSCKPKETPALDQERYAALGDAFLLDLGPTGWITAVHADPPGARNDRLDLTLGAPSSRHLGFVSSYVARSEHPR